MLSTQLFLTSAEQLISSSSQTSLCQELQRYIPYRPTEKLLSILGIFSCNIVRHGVQVFFTPLSQSLRLIIHLGEPLPEGTDFLFDFGALTCLFLFSFTLMMWTNGVGASTGMFVPALAVGAVGNCPAPLHSFSHLST